MSSLQGEEVELPCILMSRAKSLKETDSKTPFEATEKWLIASNEFNLKMLIIPQKQFLLLITENELDRKKRVEPTWIITNSGQIQDNPERVLTLSPVIKHGGTPIGVP